MILWADTTMSSIMFLNKSTSADQPGEFDTIKSNGCGIAENCLFSLSANIKHLWWATGKHYKATRSHRLRGY